MSRSEESKKWEKPRRFEVGQIWECMEEHDRKDGHRFVKILNVEVHGTGPAWTYCDKEGNPEPDGPDHPDWFWHYCDAFDFCVFGRFRWLR